MPGGAPRPFAGRKRVAGAPRPPRSWPDDFLAPEGRVRPGALIAAARPTTALLTQMWQQAETVRREWLEVGLSTEPADRSTTEEILAEVYARHRRRRPVFRWVDSPRAALPHLAGLPTHATLMAVLRAPVTGNPPLASDIAAGLSRLRRELADRAIDPPLDRPPYRREKNQPWPSLPPLEALRVKIPFMENPSAGGPGRAVAKSRARPLRAGPGRARDASSIATASRCEQGPARAGRLSPCCGWSTETRNPRSCPVDGLSGGRSDVIEVSVVVQDRGPVVFRRRGGDP